MFHARLIRPAAISLALVWTAGAHAADGFGADPAFPESRWGVSLGAFAGFEPAYEGSDEFRFVGYPLIVPRYYGANYDPNEPARVDFRGIDDIRFTAVRYGGLAVGGFVAYRFNPLFVDFAYHTQITGDTDTGYTLRFGAGIEQNLSERMALTAYVGGSYASEEYMDAYFSITPAQAALSGAGLGVFDAAAGFKDVGIDLGLAYQITDRVTLQTKAGYARLLEDAANSPVTASRNQFSGGLGFTYTFGRTE